MGKYKKKYIEDFGGLQKWECENANMRSAMATIYYSGVSFSKLYYNTDIKKNYKSVHAFTNGLKNFAFYNAQDYKPSIKSFEKMKLIKRCFNETV